MLVDGSWYPRPKRRGGPAAGPSAIGGTPSVCGVVASATLRGESSRVPPVSPTTAAIIRARDRAFATPCAAGTSSP
jgi:hypothetical protein